MPIRRVPWEKAGIAAAAKRPIPTTATQRRLNIPCSTVRRLLEGAWAQNMQAPSQGGRLQQAWDSEALSARVIAGGGGGDPRASVGRVRWAAVLATEASGLCEAPPHPPVAPQRAPPSPPATRRRGTLRRRWREKHKRGMSIACLRPGEWD